MPSETETDAWDSLDVEEPEREIPEHLQSAVLTPTSATATAEPVATTPSQKVARRPADPPDPEALAEYKRKILRGERPDDTLTLKAGFGIVPAETFETDPRDVHSKRLALRVKFNDKRKACLATEDRCEIEARRLASIDWPMIPLKEFLNKPIVELANAFQRIRCQGENIPVTFPPELENGNRKLEAMRQRKEAERFLRETCDERIGNRVATIHSAIGTAQRENLPTEKLAAEMAGLEGEDGWQFVPDNMTWTIAAEQKPKKVW